MDNVNLLKPINIIVGMIIIALSLIVLIFGNATLITLILLLASGLLFVGFGRIFNGITNEALSKTSKIAKYFTGLLSIIISLIIFIQNPEKPSFVVIFFPTLFGYALIFIAFARIAVGYLVETYPKPYRAALILIGIMTLMIAFLIFVFFPMIGYFIFLMLISLSLLMDGLARVSLGFVLKKTKTN